MGFGTASPGMGSQQGEPRLLSPLRIALGAWMGPNCFSCIQKWSGGDAVLCYQVYHVLGYFLASPWLLIYL